MKCLLCLASDWTMEVFDEHFNLQIGCFRCYALYNVNDDEELEFIGKRPRDYLFWKDLRRQWDEALDEIGQ